MFLTQHYKPKYTLYDLELDEKILDGRKLFLITFVKWHLRTHHNGATLIAKVESSYKGAHVERRAGVQGPASWGNCQVGGYSGSTTWKSWLLNEVSRYRNWVGEGEGITPKQWHMEQSHGDEKSQALGKG